MRTSRGGAAQVYHLNLNLKGMEGVCPTLFLSDDHLSVAQRTDIAELQQQFADIPQYLIYVLSDNKVAILYYSEKQFSPLHMSCTHLSHLLCLVPQPPSSASWTENCGPFLCTHQCHHDSQ